MSSRSNRSYALLSLVAALLAVGVALEAFAEAPEILRVQGVITELQGGPVADGDYTFRAEIFDVATGGSPLFSTTVSAPVVAGAYSVPLVPAEPGELREALEGMGSRFVQITVVEDATGNPIGETLLPRQQLTSVPYALGSQPTRVLVDEHQANDDPEVVLSLPTEFDRFEIDLIDVIPVSTSPVDFWLQVSSDGGATWDTGSSDYGWILLLNWEVGVTNAQNTNDDKVLLHFPDDDNRLVNELGKSYNNRILVQNPGGGNGYFALSALASYFRNAGFPNHTRITGIRKSSTRVDAVRFRVGSGNIQSGKFKVYGLR